jgi:hypothetical protein
VSPLTLKLIGAGVILALLTGMGLSIRNAYDKAAQLKEVKEELEAAVLARDALSDAVDRQVEANGRIERETAEKIAAANLAARELAGRLRNYQAMRGSLCSKVATAGRLNDAGKEPGNSEAINAGIEGVDRATEAHFAACADDAERLTGLQVYVRGLPKRCTPDAN